MEKIFYDVKIDTYRKGLSSIPPIHAKQHDSESRVLRVTLCDRGKKINITGDAETFMNILRSAKMSTNIEGILDEEGRLCFELDATALACKGKTVCDISVSNGDFRLSSIKFDMIVECSPVDGSINASATDPMPSYMRKNDYDKNRDGVVDDAKALGGIPADGYVRAEIYEKACEDLAEGIAKNRTSINDHIKDNANPHNVAADQISTAFGRNVNDELYNVKYKKASLDSDNTFTGENYFTGNVSFTNDISVEGRMITEELDGLQSSVMGVQNNINAITETIGNTDVRVTAVEEEVLSTKNELSDKASLTENNEFTGENTFDKDIVVKDPTVGNVRVVGAILDNEMTFNQHCEEGVLPHKAMHIVTDSGSNVQAELENKASLNNLNNIFTNVNIFRDEVYFNGAVDFQSTTVLAKDIKNQPFNLIERVNGTDGFLVTKDDMGDIDTALDNIIAIQNELMGVSE